jgi:hypothetical protein
VELIETDLDAEEAEQQRFLALAGSTGNSSAALAQTQCKRTNRVLEQLVTPADR